MSEENVIRQIKVAKCTEEELNETREFLQNLEHVISDNEHWEEYDEINKEIADAARKLPARAFIVPLNLGVLLDNYQDKESKIIEHPKWIKELFAKIESLEKQLNAIKKESTIKDKVKAIQKEMDETDAFLKSIEDKKESEMYKGYKYEWYRLNGHHEALRWTINQ